VGTNQRRKTEADRRTTRRQESKRSSAPSNTTDPQAAPALVTGRPVARPMPQRDRKMPSEAMSPPTVAATGTRWWDTVRGDILLSALGVLVALALYLPRLEEPPKYIYDEVYHAYTASQYAIGNADAWLWTTKAPEGVAYEWTHPPLGKLIITLGVLLFGDNSLGWRFTSAITGALGLAAVYWLGLTLTKQRLVAILAAVLTLVDGLYFVESRTGVIDIFGAVFMTCAFIALYAFVTAPPTRVRTPLLLLGLSMGLGIANKWNAVYPAALIGTFALWRTFELLPFRLRRPVAGGAAALLALAVALAPPLRSGTGLILATLIGVLIAFQLYKLFVVTPAPSEARGAGAGAGLLQHLIWVPLGLVALPLGVYLLSYVPFFLAGHTVEQLIELQRQMYYYHANLVATHAYASKWYQWPFAWKPVWYSVSYGQDVASYTYANGNPFLYWAFLPAVAFVMARWWSQRHPALPILAIGFLGQWLPWALIPRLAYIYHFLPASIFGTLAVAVSLATFWEWGRNAIGWRAFTVAYVAVVLVAFTFFYPIYSSVNLTKVGYESRIWIESWR